jgi:uroporphyrin-3 C-methyltransferase
MSNSPTDDTATAAEDAEFDLDEALETAAASRAALPGPERRPLGNAIGWLALPISIAALVGVAYLAFDDWRTGNAALQTADSLTGLDNRVSASADAVARIDEALTGLEASDAALTDQLERLQRDLESRLELLNSVSPRLANVESSLATLQGISAGARTAWLLAEAEYYLQIGNAQLQLAGNPHLATLALQLADERVAQIGDPALTAVRQAIANELTALDSMEKPDVEGVTLTLASLARVVETLPLRTISAGAGVEETAPGAEDGGLDRAWASVKSAVAGLVRVSTPDENRDPLLTPEASYLLRTNLTLQLQAARLALLRGEQAVFQQSLDDANTWIHDYFDMRSTQVASTLQTIAEIRGGLVTSARPDISGSLRLLRQFETLAEQAQ